MIAGMCVRFTRRRRLNLVMKELAEMMPVGLFDWGPEPRYNIAPTQQVAAVRATADAGQREVVPLKWGLTVLGRSGRGSTGTWG